MRHLVLVATAARGSETIPVWYAAYPLALAALCLLNAIFPRKMWGLFKSWRFKNPETVEPSYLVVAWYRFTGVVGAIGLAGLAVWLLLTIREAAACNDVMSQLSELHERGGFEAVEQRADELGMEAHEMDTPLFPPSDIEVTKGGETVGVLQPQMDDWACEPPSVDD